MPFINSDGSTLDETQYKQGKTVPTQVNSKPGWFEPGSQSEAAVRGASNAATLGLGKYIGGAVNGVMNGDPSKSTWQNVKDAVGNEVQANSNSQAANPLTYGGAGLVAGAPMGAAAVGKTALTNIATNAAIPAITALADTQDPVEAAKAAALGGALPAVGATIGGVAKAKSPILDWLANKTGADAQAVQQISEAAGKSGAGGSNVNKALKTANVKTPSQAEAKALATAVQENGVDALTPELKAAIAAQTPQPGMMDTLLHGYKSYGLGAAGGAGVGSMAGPIGTQVGAVVGGTLGLAKAAKDSLVNRQALKSLVPSPAAQAGISKLSSKLDAIGDATAGATNSGKFEAISNYLNQTDPEVRAAMNPDNPLNSEDQ